MALAVFPARWLGSTGRVAKWRAISVICAQSPSAARRRSSVRCAAEERGIGAADKGGHGLAEMPLFPTLRWPGGAVERSTDLRAISALQPRFPQR